MYYCSSVTFKGTKIEFLLSRAFFSERLKEAKDLHIFALLFSLFVSIFSKPILAETVYYVSSSFGDDKNDGVCDDDDDDEDDDDDGQYDDDDDGAGGRKSRR